MKKTQIFLFAFASLLAISLFSCRKKISTGDMQGNNSIVYESDYMSNYKFRPMEFGNTFVVVYDFDLYSDVLGQIAKQASGGKTDGVSNWFKDINVSNLKLAEETKVRLSGSDLDFNHDLINCKLVYSYYPIDNSGKKEKILATFNGYDSANNEVLLSPTGESLVNLFKNNPYGRLFLEFSFSKTGAADHYANLGYQIVFNYGYSYATMSVKE